METYINTDGILYVEAEDSTEAFALQKWYEELIQKNESKLKIIFRPAGRCWQDNKFGNCQTLTVNSSDSDLTGGCNFSDGIQHISGPCPICGIKKEWKGKN